MVTQNDKNPEKSRVALPVNSTFRRLGSAAPNPRKRKSGAAKLPGARLLPDECFHYFVVTV